MAIRAKWTWMLTLNGGLHWRDDTPPEANPPAPTEAALDDYGYPDGHAVPTREQFESLLDAAAPIAVGFPWRDDDSVGMSCYWQLVDTDAGEEKVASAFAGWMLSWDGGDRLTWRVGDSNNQKFAAATGIPDTGEADIPSWIPAEVLERNKRKRKKR